MNGRKKVGIVLGTRPEAIKMAPVIQALRASSSFDVRVVLTGQHREMVAQVLRLFRVDVDDDLNIMQLHQSLTDVTCRSLQGLDEVFRENKLDLVLVQGDTTTAFSAAIAAFYRKIPVGHVEAGLRTDALYNPYPEEANRRLISQITHLHFAPTSWAAGNLRRSGVLGEIHTTGNTVIDALLNVAATEPVCHVPGLNWESKRTLLATVHRRENWGEPLEAIAKAFLQILDEFADTALLVPLHRNPRVREPLKGLLGQHPRVFLTEPLDYAELVGAIRQSYFLMTDSGGLQEEAPSLGKPVLVLRDTTERPEAVAAGTAKLVGTTTERIVDTARELLTQRSVYQAMANASNPYGDGHAAARIAVILQEYL